MAGRLAGQSALVTGAGRGFGRSIALRLAAEGAAVTLVSRSAGQLEAVAEEIRAAGGQAIAVATDVTDPMQVRAACDAARAAHGAPSLLVSNAGVPWPFGPVWETDIEKWWAAQGVHIRAPYLFMHELMPDMIAARRGRVICISAIATKLTLPFLSAYSVGKAALNKLVEMAAEEARSHNVQVFAVEPGFVVTQLAEDTYNDPDARKWMPHMLDYLDQGRGREDAEGDLERTAERCAVLAAGDYDILSGRYMELPDPIDGWKREAELAAKEVVA
ncbi:NAD(P)-dependent dehydrogenase (short-subunit alcohol dehydrogenase family) [Sphingobium xanthum]|jgi:NAD(P)-dependent dehydrogenase (short-subunit alcohol dehydrogenase family)|uniref:SDR family NAD(P)-dependent oxidoreductase n=1 Tax=Sphingobium xanthum TaxID=1387165 RepID=UPI001C8BB430|nr:SDR family oxidoreductase [Sphingobium xanthum]